jgi:outer membrane protein assembly factor BamB
MRLGVLLVVSSAALLAASPVDARVVGTPLSRVAGATEFTSDSWLSFGHDDQLTNTSLQEAITVATAPSLHELWNAKLDGAIIASPLVANGVVYASTEAGSVYAFDASDGVVLWTRSFGPIQSYVCGSWGFSSTGVIDPTRGLLYVAAADGHLRALELTTGDVAWSTVITTRPDTEYVWGGLRLLGAQLYVPVASYCDAPDSAGVPAEGRLVDVDVDTTAVRSTFDPVPGVDNLGSIWGWGGVSIEPNGSALYTAIGNSDVFDDSCGCDIDTAGDGDSVVALSPDLREHDANRPSAVPDTGDYDFGAAPVLFDVPGCGSFAAANNKNGYLYVWRRYALSNGPVFSAGIGTPTAPFVGEPSWSASKRMLYDAGTNILHDGITDGEGVTAYSVNADCEFQFEWQKATGKGTQPPPLLLGDVLFAAGGSGGWSALDAHTGAVLWHVDTPSPTLAPASAANGRIFAGTFGGALSAFTT